MGGGVKWTVLCIILLSGRLLLAQDDFAEFEDDSVIASVTEDEGDDGFFGGSDDAVVVEDEAFDEEDDEDDGFVEDGDENDDDDDDDAVVEQPERDTFDWGEDDSVIKDGDGSSMKESLKGRKVQGKGAKPKLKFNEVPSHLRNDWKLFWVEGTLLAFILWYIFNFFVGKQKNETIAKTWFGENREFLSSQFAQVGENNEGTLIAQGHNTFTIWCTGRKGVEGMFVEINLVPRQDLISVWRNKFNRKRAQNFDTVTFSMYIDEEDGAAPMEPIVACFGQIRPMTELWRNFNDIRTFCPKGLKDKSPVLPGYQGAAESQEMMAYLFDKTSIASFTPRDGCRLNYLHASDNYVCTVDQVEEEGKEVNKEEKARKIFVVSLQLDGEETEYDSCGFLKGTMYMLDRLKRMKLSRECKQACEKRRTKAVEDEQKRQHKNRQADVAARTEARRRQMNQRIMDEEDPDKQRKLAEAQSKKDERKRQKRMNRGAKTMKIH